jgi:hypothetical protein
MSTKFDDDDPLVIKARAEARAQVLGARAKLHPLAQLLYTFLDGADNIFRGIGCVLILVIIVVAIFAPQLFTLLFRR